MGIIGTKIYLSIPSRAHNQLFFFVRPTFSKARVRCLLCSRVVHSRIVKSRLAATAKRVAIRINYFPAVVHTLATNNTGYARSRASRSVEFAQLNTHQLRLEQLVIRRLRIRLKLALPLILDLRITFVSESSRTLPRHYPNCALVLGIQERRRDFPVVNILQTSLTKPHTSHRTDGISHAAIDLHPHDQLPAVRTAGIIDADQLATEQRHARAEQLARTHVAVQPLTLR